MLVRKVPKIPIEKVILTLDEDKTLAMTGVTVCEICCYALKDCAELRNTKHPREFKRCLPNPAMDGMEYTNGYFRKRIQDEEV